MAARKKNGNREDPVEDAFAAFHQAWFSGKPLDPDAFCKSHPECAPDLRKKIDDFLFVTEGLSDVTPGDLWAPGDDEAVREVRWHTG